MGVAQLFAVIGVANVAVNIFIHLIYFEIMSTQKSDIEKFEDFELTPENAKKVEGGGVVIVACARHEGYKCLRVEAVWCGPEVASAWEIRSPRCPWTADEVARPQ